ncbi:MAG: 16S rRNA (uracil(1498)-N(3))-methyltransferase, partial [Pseudomonadota bacterium]
MRISRLFTTMPLNANSELELIGDSAHYLGKVLRLAPGAALKLFNGDGYEYPATITAVTKQTVKVTLGSSSAPATESPLHTVLALGISRGERMDYAIQKSTELGVSVVVPLFTEHCEVKLQGERVDKRQAHWQQIAVSACEQSGRVKVPLIQAPQSLAEWLPTAATTLKLVLDHEEQGALPAARPAGGVTLLIGPEGGLSSDEIAQAKAAGFIGM